MANEIWIGGLSQFIGKSSLWTRLWLMKLFVAPLSTIKWTLVLLILAVRNRSGMDVIGSVPSEV